MNRVDIVVTLGTGSINNDAELRFMLRSLEENFLDFGTVWIIGHCPDWLDQSQVRHIQFPDPWHHKDSNLICKVLRACVEPDLTDLFLIQSDDQFLLKPSKAQALVRVWKEWPSQAAISYEKQFNSTWHRRHHNTLARVCPQYGLTTESIESHIPYPAWKTHYLNRMLGIAHGQGDGIVTHIYSAFLVKDGILPLETPRPGALTTRVKHAASAEFFKSINSRFLNLGEHGYSPQAANFLAERFPTPSRFEADLGQGLIDQTQQETQQETQ
jgi:hypothetical protein